MSDAPEKGRVSAAQRRDHLLDVTARVVLAEGTSAVNMERIAEAAGVSKGLVYFHFENRADLLLQLLEREAKAADEQVKGAVSRARGLEARVRAALDAYFDFLTEHGGVIGPLMVDRSIEDHVAPWTQRRQKSSRLQWRRCLEAEVGLRGEEADAAANLLDGLLSMAGNYWRSSGADRQVVIDTHVDLVVSGVLALKEKQSA